MNINKVIIVNYRTLVLSLSLLSIIAVSKAFAQSESPSHWYFQGELGYSVLSDACAAGYTACEDDALGLSGSLGYQITPSFALQGGYRHLGTFERTQAGNTSEVILSALELMAVGSYPLNSHWSVYGAVGASLGQSVYSNGTVLDNLSSDGINLSPLIGGGARYHIDEQWQVYSGVQWSSDVAGSTTDSMVMSLGIRYSLNNAKPVLSVTPSATEVKTREVLVEKIMVSLPSLTRNAYFGFNEVVVSPQAERDLKPVVERLTSYPESHVRLLGFADSTGSVEANRIVSERRVNAVADYLVTQGVDETQITTESFGKVDPTYSNDTAEGRALNRRVSLIMDAIQVEQTQ